MTFRRLFVRGIAFVVVGLFVSGSAEAQQILLRYEPATPTISPYVSLTRISAGGFPSYYAFVRPLLRQAEFNAVERDVRIQQGSEISRLAGELETPGRPVAATGTGSWFMTTTDRTQYLNTSRYYPTPATRGSLPR